MDLKSILSKKKNDEEYFWSLIIEPEWVSAGIWRLRDSKVQVIFVSPPSSWNLDEELVSACDASCSSVVQNFPEDLNPPTKTVFGVISSWVEGGEIKPEYLSKIKKVCSELSLTPVGFVVMAEALSNYYKSEEGGQVNAIFLGISQNNLELSIFRLGKLVGVSQIARSVSVVEDVTEGLSRFYSGEAYPSRIILYNSKEGELDEIKQELIKADWEGFKEVKFLHTPKIEIVTPDRKIYAVCLAGGAEMGSVEKVSSMTETLPPQEKEKEQDVEETNVQDFPKEQVSNLTEPAEDISPEDFGFTVNTDNSEYSDSERKPSQGGDAGNFLESDQKRYPPAKPQDVQVKDKKRRFKIFSIFDKISLPKVKISGPPLKFSFKAPKTIFIGLLFLIALSIGLFAFWWFFPKAEVTLYVSPKKIEDEVEISVDASLGSSDFDNKIISGEVMKETTSSEKSVETTGTKVVGDKAMGEITIYRAGSSINLAKNSLVKGPQSLNFSLDEDITIASGSVLTRGITKAKVTAKEIGAQYNLASGTTFTVSNYSTADMEATNESSFSGGTSREVSAVSEDDQKNLLKDLQSELEGKLKEVLVEGVSSDFMLIEDSTTYSVIKKEFDKKIGDEGTSLKLNLELEADGIAVKRSDIEEIGLKYLSQRVPSGYSLKNDQIQADFTYISKKDDVYSLKLFVSADLLPQINVDEIRKNITGKFPDIAEEYMNKNVPGFERAVINFKNIRLPGRLGTLPRISGNIEISVSADK
jgi:hypothetical protein